MSKLLRSYLNYARGEGGPAIWGVFGPCQYVTRAWMKLRIGLFKRGIFRVTDPVLPTVSIGNNCFGGTNKTPMSEYIVRQFGEAGIRAGLVSRGYRAKNHPPLWVGQDEKSKSRDFAGDEPLMLAKRLPGTKVVVSRNRIEGVKLLASLGVDIAVTDDTFQHRKMGRDVDIVLVDSTCPFGNGQVLPAGSMREPMSAYRRADIVVLTRANQAEPKRVEEIKETLSHYVPRENIFTADIVLEKWLSVTARGEETMPEGFLPHGRCIAISAIGNPRGFYRYVEEMGVNIVLSRTFRDHEILTAHEIASLDADADRMEADAFICTEKDLMNLPKGVPLARPLYVPTIKVSLNDSLAFRRKIMERLRPRFLVASNGHGEDAIGVVLAKKIKERFPCAQTDAFAYVGSGKPYTDAGVNVISPPADMPSGGVVRNNPRALMRDIQSGLRRSMKEQCGLLRSLFGEYRTPICVGDVFLFMNVLWGQGMRPMLVATAKTVHLSGHMWLEKWLLRHRAILVLTRDEETAKELTDSGVPAIFSGNPIMDLLDDVRKPSFAWQGSGAKVLLLPGSRERAYADISLVLGAAEKLAEKLPCSFLMVPAPTIDMKKMMKNLHGWALTKNGKRLSSDKIKVTVSYESVAAAAYGAEVLIGLGGTANQLCAGLGIPVISIREPGKLRQKKLIREAEILVDATPEALADAAMKVLTDDSLRRKMQEAGVRNLGRTGALEKVVEYCAEELGWERRCRVYEKYRDYLDSLSQKSSRS